MKIIATGTPAESNHWKDGSSAARSEMDSSSRRFRLGDPVADESFCLGRWRNACGKAVNSKVAQVLFAILLVGNLIIQGLYVNAPSRHLDVARNIFVCIFTIETGLQILYLGPMIIKSPWIFFDLVIMETSWFLKLSPVFRTLDLIHILNNLTSWPIMRQLSRGLHKAASSLSILAAFWILWMLSFSVLFTDWFGNAYNNGDTSEDYFDTLGKSFFSLFQIMTLDGWSTIARDVSNAYYPWMRIHFVLFIGVSWFVLALVVAVLVGSFLAPLTTGLQHDQQGDVEAETIPSHALQRRIIENQLVMQEALLAIVQSSGADESQQKKVATILSRVSGQRTAVDRKQT